MGFILQCVQTPAVNPCMTPLAKFPPKMERNKLYLIYFLFLINYF